MNFNQLLSTPSMAPPSESEKRSALEKQWRERGYRDAQKGKPRLSREKLLELGGQDAVGLYFAGYRCGLR